MCCPPTGAFHQHINLHESSAEYVEWLRDTTTKGTKYDCVDARKMLGEIEGTIPHRV